MAKMILTGTMLCAHECLPAATLHRLAQMASKLGSIIIIGTSGQRERTHRRVHLFPRGRRLSASE